MIGGFGGIQGMITSLRNNKNLLGKRKSMFENERKKVKGNSIPEGLNCNLKPTEKQLSEIKTRLQRRNTIKNYLFSSAAIIGLTLAFYFGFLIYKADSTEQIKPMVSENINQKYLNYIKYGDTWLEDKKWNAAIHNYKQALDMFPEDYAANYRLALAYTYSCSNENKNCEEGSLLLNVLITKFGSNPDLEYLFGIIDNR